MPPSEAINSTRLYEESLSAESVGTEAIFYTGNSNWFPVLDGIAFDSKNFHLAIIGDRETGIYSGYRLLGDYRSDILDSNESLLMTPSYGETKFDSVPSCWREWPNGPVHTTYAESVLSRVSQTLQPKSSIKPAEHPFDSGEESDTPNLAQLYEVTVDSSSLNEYDPLFMRGQRRHDTQQRWFPVIDQFTATYDGMNIMVYMLADPDTGAYSHLDCPNFAGCRTVLCTTVGLPSPVVVEQDLKFVGVEGLIPHQWPEESVWKTICESQHDSYGITAAHSSDKSIFEDMILPDEA